MIINGTSASETLRGTSGDDTIQGFNGNDTLIGGDGDDSLSGGAGYDDFVLDPVSTGSNSGDSITDFEAGDTLRIGEQAHFSLREPFDFLIFVGTAAFSSVAGETRYSTGGGETLVEVDFDGDGSADYSVTLTNGEFTLRQTSDRFIGLEVDSSFGGSPSIFDDTVGGTNATDNIVGMEGNDELIGAGGDDFLSGGSGNDTLKGGAGDDFLSGNEDNDILHYSEGFDTIYGGSGTDTLISNRDGQVDLTITDSLISDSISGESAILSSIELVSISHRTAGDFDDTIDGSASTMNFFLFGGGGNDIIVGGAGSDLAIEGDSGRDTLSGGLGADVFTFDFLYEFDVVGDTVLDFEPGDTLDFHIVELAFTALSDPDSVIVDFIGKAAFSGSIGEMRYFHSNGKTIIVLDSDGDGVSEHRVTLANGEFNLVDVDLGDFELLQISADSSASNSADSLVGSNGDDTMNGLGGNDTVYGLDGNDSLKGAGGADLVFGGIGDDTLNGQSGNDSLEGGAGNDSITGGSNDDTLRGADGADSLLGEGGKDFIVGNNGDDFIRGGTENDDLRGSVGEDTLFGDNGRDYLRGNGDNDDLRGGAGGDTLDGGLDNDELRGASGDDTLNGRFGDDLLSAGIDNDLLRAHDGNDTLIGGDGDDTLFGNPGDDIMNGGNGNDDLRGGNEDDTLSGDDGNDTLRGNSGDDQFNFALGDDADQIIGFVAGAATDDVIAISGFGTAFDEFAEVQAVASDDGNGNTVIDFGGGDTITLSSVSAASLHEDDFVFV